MRALLCRGRTVMSFTEWVLSASWRSLVLAVLLFPFNYPAQAEPRGELKIAVHISLAPTWFDPAETPGIITPYLLLYALHDAMVKPMPAGTMTPGIAESWSVSEDGYVYEFTLRDGVKFHNGDLVTAEDVKYSFERYRGTAQGTMRARVAAIEIPDPRHIRFRLKDPWPDFLTFYANATGAGWIVPKKYLQAVGDDGFRKAPIGAGPYRFVSFVPGVELVVEAFDSYWRKVPEIKRIVFKVIPDEATRLIALKRGEVDAALSIRGELAAEVERTPGLKLKTTAAGPFWLYFPGQWDPKSPWHDVRVRRAAKLAIDHKTINQSLTLGHSLITGSIIPESFDFYWRPPPQLYDPARAKALLAEAGYPNGFDAGFYTCDISYANLAEVVLNNLREVGIRAKLRPMERAAFFKGFADRKFDDIIQAASGAFGNAATRLEAFVVKDGTYAYGSYPDIDVLFPRQASEMDIVKRAKILSEMQYLVDDRAMFVPIWQLAFLSAVGPRVKDLGFGAIKGYVYPGPYEDMTLKER